MTASLRVETSLDLSVDELWERLGDEDFLRFRAGAEPALPSTLLGVEKPDEDRLTIVSRAPVPAQWLPSAFRSRISSSSGITRTERWRRTEGRLSADTSFELGGLPARAAGVTSYEDEGTGSRRLVQEVEVEVSLPFVAGTVESVLVERMREALEREGTAYGRWRGR